MEVWAVWVITIAGFSWLSPSLGQSGQSKAS